MSKYFQAKLNPIQDTYVNRFFELPLREYATIAAEKQKRSDVIGEQLGNAIDSAYGLQASKELVADVEFTRQFKQNLDQVRQDMINVEDWTNPKVRTLYDSRIKKLTLDPRTLNVKSNYDAMAAELKRQQELSDDFKTSDPRYLQFRSKISKHNQLYPSQEDVGQFTGSYEAAYDVRKELQESMKNIKAEKTSDPKIGTKWVYIENGVELTEDQIVQRSLNSLSTRALEELNVNYEYSPEKQSGVSWEEYVTEQVRGQARLFVQKEKEITGLRAQDYNLEKYKAGLIKPDEVVIPTILGSYTTPAGTQQKDFTAKYHDLNTNITMLESFINSTNNPNATPQDIAQAKQQLAIAKQEKSNMELQREQWLAESKKSGLYETRLDAAYRRYTDLAKPNTPFTKWTASYRTDSPEDLAILEKAAETSGNKVMTKKEFEQKIYPELHFSKELGVLNAEQTFPEQTQTVATNYSADPKSSYQQFKKLYEEKIKTGSTSDFTAPDGKKLGEVIGANVEIKSVEVAPGATGEYASITINGVPKGMFKYEEASEFNTARVAAANSAAAADQAKAAHPDAANNVLARQIQAISTQNALFSDGWKTVYDTPGTVSKISGVDVKTVKYGSAPSSRQLLLKTGDNKWEPVRNANGQIIQFSGLQAMKEWLGQQANSADYSGTYLKNSKTGEVQKNVR